MPILFDDKFDNTQLKTLALTRDIDGLKRFITPDDELLDGHDMLGYRLEREKASVDELKNILQQKTYIRSVSDEENNHKKEEILAQIKEHEADIQNLNKQRIEIPKAITRLEKVKNAKKEDVLTFKISHDTTRDEIKTVLKELDIKLKKLNTSSEKRLLTYLKGHFETAKTILDAGKELQDTYCFVHKSELKYFAKLKSLEPTQIMVASSMLENVLKNLKEEQDRLRRNNSPIHQSFTQPIVKIEQRLAEVKKDPSSIKNTKKMKETVMVIAKLSNTVQREKAVSPSFKDRLRNFVNGFRAFMDNAFGIKIPEAESLKSKTLTNMFDTQREIRHLARIIPKENLRDVKPVNRRPQI